MPVIITKDTSMLTSTKRRILHILSVSLAIMSVAYGLVLKYDKSDLENLVVQSDMQNKEVVTKEPAAIIKANNPITNPD